MTYLLESLPVPENLRLEVLREDFCGIFDESKKAEAIELFEKIAKEYRDENRKYHDFEYIERMIAFLRACEQEIKDKVVVKLATYFHDIVYDTSPPKGRSSFPLPVRLINRDRALILSLLPSVQRRTTSFFAGLRTEE